MRAKWTWMAAIAVLVTIIAVPAIAVPYRSRPVPRPQPRPAAPDDFNRRFLIGADFALTAGGAWNFDVPGQNASDSPMDVGFGFDVYGEYKLMRFFRAGLQFAMIWTNNDYWDRHGVDRTYLMDISARFRVPFFIWNDKLAIYVQLPIGFTMANPATDTPVSPKDNRHADTGYGMNVGGYLGVQFFVAPRISAHVDFGYLFHWFEWQSQASSATGTSEVDVRNSFHQFGFQFGFAYAL